MGIVVFGAILLLLSNCDIQRKLIYRPGKTTLSDVKQYVVNHDLLMWPDNDATYQGIISQKGPPFFRGTVVIFHGNSGPAMFHKYYFLALEARGYRVVLVEYPGYGGRPGELSEKSFVADGRRTALQAMREFGGPLYMWGQSLGCGVVSALAADTKLHPRGIVLLAPWDSLLNEAETKFLGYLSDSLFTTSTIIWRTYGALAARSR